MRWIKCGRIFDPTENVAWITHSQGPTVLVREQYLRIYFASRPESNISLPTYVDVDSKNPRKILAINQSSLLELGGYGTFDEFGIIPCDVVEKDGEVWLYYT